MSKRPPRRYLQQTQTQQPVLLQPHINLAKIVLLALIALKTSNAIGVVRTTPAKSTPKAK